MFEHDVVFLQRLLKSLGLYSKRIDGIMGPGTKNAMAQFQEVSNKIKATYSTFDKRTEENIATLHPVAQVKARTCLEKVLHHGINAKIISGTRTYAEQNILYSIGRTKPGKPVTKARGGQSWHNFCMAWDIGIFKGSKYLQSSDLYEEVGRMGEEMGLEWGGSWSFYDPSHLQLKTGLVLAEVRRMFEKGTAFLPWGITEM